MASRPTIPDIFTRCIEARISGPLKRLFGGAFFAAYRQGKRLKLSYVESDPKPWGNVNKKLFLRLLVPGIIGAVLDAIFLAQVDGKVMMPFISVYLLLMGVYILSKAWRKIKVRSQEPNHVGKPALFGGFVDSAGSGGWGRWSPPRW